MEGLTIGTERAPTRCPYCRDGLDPSKELVACAPCGARHHAACHAAHGRCASCGATDVLVPARRRARREEPPAGSKLRVDAGDGATTYTWDAPTKNDLVIIWLMFCLVLTIPLALWFMRLRRRHPTHTVTLRPEELEFTAITPSGMSARTIRARRGDVGAVRVQSGVGGAHMLTIDIGIERHTLMNGITGASLSAPELEWLAARLCAWRDE